MRRIMRLAMKSPEPGQLEARLAEFVDYYKTRRYRESLLTSLRPTFTAAAVTAYSNGGIPLGKTVELRLRLHHLATASTSTPMGQTLS
jgi:hypothetical protein